MAKRKTFDDWFQEFAENLYADGTATRWKAEKRLKQQTRKLNKLEREEKEIRKILEGLRGKKSA
jgi:hypothetical protein